MFKILCGIVLLILLILVGYIVYLFVSYDRVEDHLSLKIEGQGEEVLPADGVYTAVTYNIGFAAYTPEFSFFMDGGSESRAFSEESVVETTEGIIDLMQKEDADFLFLEEVDENATRSYHVDEKSMIEERLSGYTHSFAVNFDSAYLFIHFISHMEKVSREC